MRSDITEIKAKDGKLLMFQPSSTALIQRSGTAMETNMTTLCEHTLDNAYPENIRSAVLHCTPTEEDNIPSETYRQAF